MSDAAVERAFADGAPVWIDGLEARPELNGLLCRVLSFDEARRRYAVDAGCGSILLKEANLKDGTAAAHQRSLPCTRRGHCRSSLRHFSSRTAVSDHRKQPSIACPGRCGLAVTWHHSFCCEACRLGSGHGPRCEYLPAHDGTPSKEEAKRLILQLIDPPRWRQSLAIALHKARTASRSENARLELTPDYPGLSLLHSSPPIFQVDDFLSDTECEALVAYAPPRLQLSNTAGKVTQVRTSRTCYVDRHDALSRTVFGKVSRLTGKAADHLEDMQVARYERGEFYEAHFDGADPHDADAELFFRGGGQRICTVLVYLNDVSEGGATRFAQLDLDVRPRRGRALIFFPGFLDGKQARADDASVTVFTMLLTVHFAYSHCQITYSSRFQFLTKPALAPPSG